MYSPEVTKRILEYAKAIESDTAKIKNACHHPREDSKRKIEEAGAAIEAMGFELYEFIRGE